mmetsp:Transcript_33282/g.56966  ORF Transcript_33282/g.56966 Transcript_33282/m.56966 type:complete len:230 (+) Transcript_33282:428-1117(+)
MQVLHQRPGRADHRTGNTVQVGLAAHIFDNIAGSLRGSDALLVMRQCEHQHLYGRNRLACRRAIACTTVPSFPGIVRGRVFHTTTFHLLSSHVAHPSRLPVQNQAQFLFVFRLHWKGELDVRFGSGVDVRMGAQQGLIFSLIARLAIVTVLRVLPHGAVVRHCQTHHALGHGRRGAQIEKRIVQCIALHHHTRHKVPFVRLQDVVGALELHRLREEDQPGHVRRVEVDL